MENSEQNLSASSGSSSFSWTFFWGVNAAILGTIVYKRRDQLSFFLQHYSNIQKLQTQLDQLQKDNLYLKEKLETATASSSVSSSSHSGDNNNNNKNNTNKNNNKSTATGTITTDQQPPTVAVEQLQKEIQELTKK